jgi:hypothetical protein
VDETWFSKRKSELTDRQQKVVPAKEWRGALKFQRPNAHRFLAGIRTAAMQFILQTRL